jgi:hypothetical protein
VPRITWGEKILQLTSAADRWLDALIDGYLDPVLRERGFFRQDRTWNRDLGAVRHVIDVQTDASDDSDRSPIPSRFTINLAIFVPAHKTWLGKSPPAFVLEVDCPVRQRIGQIMPSGVDRWWFIRLGPAMPNVGTEVANSLLNYGLPFLNRHDSLEHVAAWIEQPRHYHAPLRAAIRATLGDRDGARDILDKLDRDGWHDVVVELKSRFGLA